MENWHYWAIIAVVAFVAEAATAGLVSVWFGLAAIVTAIFSAFAEGLFGSEFLFLTVQILLFAVLSVVFLYLTKPLSKKLIQPKETNALSIIGKEAVVLSDINNTEGEGTVKIDGMIWSAKSENNEIIKKGETVNVEAIAGVKAVVARKVN